MIKSLVIALLLIIVFSIETIAQKQLLTDIKGNTYQWTDLEIKKFDQEGTLLFTWQKSLDFTQIGDKNRGPLRYRFRGMKLTRNQ